MFCFDDDDECDDEDEEEFGEMEMEDDEDEDRPSNVVSTDSTILEPITFQWNDETYEFEELCDVKIIKKAPKDDFC